MAGKILITGGTGLIGTRLSEMLIDSGYEVAHLSRQTGQFSRYKTFRWDIKNHFIDDHAISWADYIINLAGAGVSDEKWTEERKKEILNSRVESTNLLFNCLKSTPNRVKGFLAASAIGIYGDSGEQLVTEESPYADDFLADVAKKWEAASWQMHSMGIRTVIFRIGIVLSDQGGALPQMAKPIKLMAGAPLGSGKQYMSWIHIDDLCQLFIKAIEEPQFHGVFNAVSPNPVTNETFTKALAEVMHRPLLVPKIPAFGLKLVLGELSEVVLGGSKVSSAKIQNTGFTFEYSSLEEALASFYHQEA
ncbi:TIGR01777 family oxidoreductase [Adhaeribacter soli]|uniref:TIGR01777 family protein n=1 Tax=Adhaeribacter soli TaxID=2607655 RepID=A0A5N1IU39_9BACT|nr:TIGR01777 family oxidoreductase [Adhaeribacter soli]KAA9333530.1 TIGR01777 family protein [Adhaeribacter soli]